MVSGIQQRKNPWDPNTPVRPDEPKLRKPGEPVDDATVAVAAGVDASASTVVLETGGNQLVCYERQAQSAGGLWKRHVFAEQAVTTEDVAVLTGPMRPGETRDLFAVVLGAPLQPETVQSVQDAAVLGQPLALQSLIHT